MANAEYADATPMPLPDPALGMRVWFTESTWGDARVKRYKHVDIDEMRPDAVWGDFVPNLDTIVVITNRHKGDVVLWERSEVSRG